MSDDIKKLYQSRLFGDMTDDEHGPEPDDDSADDGETSAFSEGVSACSSASDSDTAAQRGESPVRGTSKERFAAKAASAGAADPTPGPSGLTGPVVPHMIIHIPVERDARGRLVQPKPTQVRPPAGCSLILCNDARSKSLYWRAVPFSNTRTHPTELPDYLRPMAVFTAPDGTFSFRHWPSKIEEQAKNRVSSRFQGFPFNPDHVDLCVPSCSRLLNSCPIRQRSIKPPRRQSETQKRKRHQPRNQRRNVLGRRRPRSRFHRRFLRRRLVRWPKDWPRSVSRRRYLLVTLLFTLFFQRTDV